MTAPDLSAEIIRILTDEKGYPAMTAASLRNVLHALGFSPLPSETEIVQTLDALMTSGHVEAVHSTRLGKRFRIQRNDRGDMSEPQGAA